MSDEIKALLASAPLSFLGTVDTLGAALSSDAKADDHTAIVHVDRVLHSPDSLTRIAGQRVTVQLSSKSPLPKVGDNLAFFVQGVAFGATITVAEVGRLAASAVQPHIVDAMRVGRVASAFDGLQREMKQDTVRSRMKAADSVVVGTVVGVAKAGPPSHSEHDPDWWRATIDVTHAERGPVGNGEVHVLFANSRDVRWKHAPKLQAGQTGVWVLHASEAKLSSLAPYQILHPDDVQPIQQLDLLRTPGS